MKRLLAAAALTLPAIMASAPASAAVEVGVDVDGPVVEIQTQQQVMGDPDKAMVGAGVTTRAQTAVAAMQQNATQMDAVLKKLKALGVPDNRIQTSGITLNPQYQYNNSTQQPRFLGYDATNTVSIELRDLERVGPVLDALVAAGANNLNGPTWGVVDDTSRKAQARKAAFDQAMAQAREYARMAGYGNVRLLAIEESMGYSQPMYDRAMAIQTNAAPPPPPMTPTRPGQVATTVGLTMKFELVR
ncbi:SIMPL domain-containing protein [Croceicoccus bisphenolivorans]|uniref:SIMPL domain-containing protein n=1 Tax=Croceicoccus bisphenolivorans TaxID=1783232 RepID=UPI0008296CF4|nr:SIMPL domain-containing protein [Croceicoccus bisphenolivorans]